MKNTKYKMKIWGEIIGLKNDDDMYFYHPITDEKIYVTQEHQGNITTFISKCHNNEQHKLVVYSGCDTDWSYTWLVDGEVRIKLLSNLSMSIRFPAKKGRSDFILNH